MTKQGALAGRAALHLILAGVTLLTLLPFLWMISTALKDFGEVFLYPPRWIPSRFAWENFREVFDAFPFGRFLFNSAVVTVIRTVGTLVTASMGAYAFARLSFRGRDALFLLYLGTLMVPFQVRMIPLFVMMRAFGWLDTFWALTIPGIFTAFGTFLLRQFFLTIPQSLEEAAFVDGATHLQVFTRIILPLSQPALATLAVLTFLGSWNDFLWPLVVTSKQEMMTLVLGLGVFQGYYYTEWNLLMAGALVTIAPTVVMYLLMRRYVVEGITMSGLKY